MSSNKSKGNGWSVIGVLVILVIMIVVVMVFAPESVDKTKPVGKVVGVQQDQTNVKAMLDIYDRFKEQPSREARLNMLAQEACAIDAELLRDGDNSLDTPRERELLERFGSVSSLYKGLEPTKQYQGSLIGRQNTYCRGEHRNG